MHNSIKYYLLILLIYTSTIIADDQILSGVINTVNATDRTITINNRVYQLTADTRIHDGGQLTPGSIVILKLNDSNIIDEIALKTQMKLVPIPANH